MNKLSNKLIYHFVDSTAIITVMNPLMTGMEIGFADMSNNVSINARLLGSVLTYAGLGSLYSKGRDLSKKTFKITKNSSKFAKNSHDALYTIAYTCLLQPPFYYASGSRSIKEIAMGTLATAALALVSGPLMGLSIDTYRDMTGLEESNRLPEFVNCQTPKTKKYIAGLLTAASVGALAAVYALK